MGSFNWLDLVLTIVSGVVSYFVGHKVGFGKGSEDCK